MSILLLILSLSLASAEDQALEQTKNLLRDRDAREKSVKDTKGAKAMQDVKNLTGGDAVAEDEIYGLASDVMPILMEEAKGDPNKMMQILEEAKNNPEAFAKRWTPEQRKRLKTLSEKLGTKSTTPSH